VRDSFPPLGGFPPSSSREVLFNLAWQPFGLFAPSRPFPSPEPLSIPNDSLRCGSSTLPFPPVVLVSPSFQCPLLKVSSLCMVAPLPALGYPPLCLELSETAPTFFIYSVFPPLLFRVRILVARIPRVESVFRDKKLNPPVTIKPYR